MGGIEVLRPPFAINGLFQRWKGRNHPTTKRLTYQSGEGRALSEQAVDAQRALLRALGSDRR